MIEPLPMRRLAKALSVVAALCAIVIPPAAEEEVATIDGVVGDDFVGRWESSYGTLVLEQKGKRIVGTYMRGSSISGVVEDGRFVYRYEEANASGQGWFAVVDGGEGLAGKWKADGNERWFDWVATRIPDPAASFDGLWETTYGRMRLSVDGAKVTGTYSFSSGSRVAGEVEGDRMEFVYVEPNARGEGWFELSEDGTTFHGRWHPEGSTSESDWTGTRIEPTPDRVWLVILEAHWERDIAEEEYAFGDMLRSYFTMASARHVEVRQRSFHDEQDFRRFASEVAYIAEPVVLLISTHGTPKGIQVAGTTIGPDAIAESLRDASNLELLHLSGCSMMNGPVPERILAGIEPGSRFPISGYSTPVAWDASALADFTFLNFLLVHRLAPEEAVQQAHLAAPYTSKQKVQGSRFQALGLDVLTPSEL